MFINHFCHTLPSGGKQDLNITLEDLSEPLEDQIKTFEDLSEASELFGNICIVSMASTSAASNEQDM